MAIVRMAERDRKLKIQQCSRKEAQELEQEGLQPVEGLYGDGRCGKAHNGSYSRHHLAMSTVYKFSIYL